MYRHYQSVRYPFIFYLSIPLKQLTVPADTPLAIPVVPMASLTLASDAVPRKPELCLFVGPPAIGKSSFYRKHFQPEGYIHVNQDTLGTRPKCIKATKEALENGQSVVVGERWCCPSACFNSADLPG